MMKIALLSRTAIISCFSEVKDFLYLTNLSVIRNNERFDKISFGYLSGNYVSLEFRSMHTKEKFPQHTGVRS